MSKLKKVIQLITDPVYRFDSIAYRGGYQNLSDEEFLKKKWKIFYGTELNLENPTTFCEKLQWLKLYNRKPEYTYLVDKCEAKRIAKEKGLNVIPAYGVWNNFDEIDFDKLPNQFVLKNTHDSGGYIICKDKSSFDKEKARKKLTARMSRNFFYFGREWPYKNVKPRILAEKYIPELGNPESVEYKITCFDGKVDFITVCRGVPHAELIQRKNDFYDREWNFLPFRTAYYDNSGMENKKPEQLDQMIEVAELMGEGIPYSRVDVYVIDGKVYFGEITFFTWSGFIHFIPEEYDKILGEKIVLPEKNL